MSGSRNNDPVIELRTFWYISIAAWIFSTSSFVNAPLRHGMPDSPPSFGHISQVGNSKAHQPPLSLCHSSTVSPGSLRYPLPYNASGTEKKVYTYMINDC